jgi:lysophospholipase L1-like esterase
MPEAGPRLNGRSITMRQDFRAAPVRRMVVMGESNAYGMCATDPENEWVQVVASLIRRHQDGYLQVRNNSIPANVLSPAAPGYIPFRGEYATAPSALERYEDDMVAHRPDLAVYAYGLNDSRCGHATSSFIRDYETIVSSTRRELTDALIVLVGPYWNPQYDRELWSSPGYEHQRASFGAFARAGDDLVRDYNSAIRDLADRYGCLFVDAYATLQGALWLIHDDACHLTDIGQALLGMEVFAQVATNCSFLSRRSIAAYQEGGFSIHNTGGTNGLPAAIMTWRYMPEDKEPWK